MKKEDFIKLGLEEEQAVKAAEASAKELEGFIPKNRFDEVNNLKIKAEKDVATRDNQIVTLSKVDEKGMQEEITRLLGVNKTEKESYDSQVAKIKLDAKLDSVLTSKYKSKDNIAVKAHLNMESIKLDGENLLGLDEQMKPMTEKSGYLFGDMAGDTGDSGNPPNTLDLNLKDNPWAKKTRNLTEQGRIVRENPALAMKLAKEAGKILNI